MEVAPDRARGGRWSSVLGRLGRPFCAAAPLTLTSSSAPSSAKAPGGPRQSLTAAAAERSGASTVVAAAEAGDVLQPLPLIPVRSSHVQRFNRPSTSGPGQLSTPGSVKVFVTSATAVSGAVGRQSSRGGGVSFATAPTAGTAAVGARAVSAKRAAFPSHTLGSLTAWQMLAADVQQEMEAGAAGLGRASEGSEQRLSACSSRNRSSQVEPAGLGMSECSEVEEGQRRSSSMLFPHHQHPPQQAQPQQQQRANGDGRDSTAATAGSNSGGGQLASDGSLTGEAAAAAAADGAPAT